MPRSYRPYLVGFLLILFGVLTYANHARSAIDPTGYTALQVEIATPASALNPRNVSIADSNEIVWTSGDFGVVFSSSTRGRLSFGGTGLAGSGINNAGTVVFSARIAGTSRILTGGTGPILADGTFPSINNSGEIAYICPGGVCTVSGGLVISNPAVTAAKILDDGSILVDTSAPLIANTLGTIESVSSLVTFAEAVIGPGKPRVWDLNGWAWNAGENIVGVIKEDGRIASRLLLFTKSPGSFPTFPEFEPFAVPLPPAIVGFGSAVATLVAIVRYRKHEKVDRRTSKRTTRC